MKTFDAIVAGAGIWGCTVARRLAEAGKRVLVLEKRATVGGNCRCEIDPETGIEVHTYGSHIFHTSNEEVWAFVRRFTEFNGYRHCVLARTKACGREGVGGRCRCTADVSSSPCVDLTQRHKDTEVHREVLEEGEARSLGCNPRSKNLCDPLCPCASVLKPDRRAMAEKTVEDWLAGVDETTANCSLMRKGELCAYHLPIGKTLLEEFFGVSMKDRNLKEFLATPQTSPTSQPSQPSQTPQTSPTYGDAIFDAFIRGYTSKQWGVPPEKVDPSIIARLKVRDNYSTDYFDDPHQGIPSEGYNRMFERMLDHPNITVKCGCELVIEKVGGESRSTAEGEEKKVGQESRSTADGPNLPSHAGSARERGSDFQVASLKVRGEGAEEINKFLCPPTFSTYSLPIYYSGPIDALFNYKYGPLPWRTLRFERETLPVADYQGNSVVNYTDAEVPFTRIHEFKHYHPEWMVREKVGGESRSTAVELVLPARGGTRSTSVCNSVNCTDGRDNSSVCAFDANAPTGEGAHGENAPTGKMRPRKSAPKDLEQRPSSQKTIIMREYSATWKPGDEPYYPIDNADSRALFALYQSELEKLNHRCPPPPNFSTSLTIGGRLGQYKYFDMDKSIAAALAVEI